MRLGTYWKRNGTKVLGSASALISGWQAIPGLVSAGNLKWWQAVGVALGVMTVNRGFTNAAQAKKDE